MHDESPGLKTMLDRVWDRAELKTRGIDMTWACTRLEDVHEQGDEAHVHPVYEEHVIDRACWCGPRRIEDVEQYPIWLHRDTLDLHGPKDRDPTPVFPEEDDDVLDFFLNDRPTVGYCSKCGEARSEFYTCRDGGATVSKEAAASGEIERGQE